MEKQERSQRAAETVVVPFFGSLEKGLEPIRNRRAGFGDTVHGLVGKEASGSDGRQSAHNCFQSSSFEVPVMVRPASPFAWLIHTMVPFTVSEGEGNTILMWAPIYSFTCDCFVSLNRFGATRHMPPMLMSLA